MRIRKTKITCKNIHMMNGLMRRFFDSIEIGEEYQCHKWQNQDGYSYTFFKAQFSLVDNKIIFELPVKLSISIGDTIHLDGNHLIIQRPMKQFDNSIYCDYHMYKRITTNKINEV